MTIEGAIARFCADMNEKAARETYDMRFQADEPGREYVRVRHGSAAYCFVDTYGRIWKPKSFRSPVKNFSRGNVFDQKTYAGFSVYGI